MPTFMRLSWDDAVIVAAAIAVFVFMRFSAGGGESADAPVGTTTPTATASPAAGVTIPAATPAIVSPSAPAPAAGVATPAATPSPASEARGPASCDFPEELARVRGAVVQVFAGTNLRQAESAWTGTGFHIGGGRYVTAAHVIQDDDGNLLPDILVRSWAEGREMPATVLQEGFFSEQRTERDLATLRADPIGHALETRPPADSDIAWDVRALGYPWSRRGDDLQPRLSRGAVSAVTTSDGVAIVQVDVSTEQGMSGGPLVDECGTAIGVASFVPLRFDDNGETEGDFAVFISVAELANLR